MTTYFIHGFLEDNSMWDSIGFPANIQPRFIELPGHGRKLKDSCPNKMSEIAHLVAQEISDSSYNIVGHSMGGYLIGSLLEIGIRPQKIGLFHSKLGEDGTEKKEQRMRAIDLVKENKSFNLRKLLIRRKIIEIFISDIVLSLLVNPVKSGIVTSFILYLFSKYFIFSFILSSSIFEQ